MELEGRGKTGKSIYRTILVPMMILLVVETILLAMIPSVGGVFAEMDRNKEEILEQQVRNRRNYLETHMTSNWSDLNRLSGEINSAAQTIMVEHNLTMEQLQNSPDRCEEFLNDISNAVIEELYLKRASGIYVMLNMEDLRPARINGQLPARQGLYIRDIAPETAPTVRHGDLVLVRGPLSVADAEDLRVTQEWKSQYIFGEAENPTNYDFLYQPFQAAYESEHVLKKRDYGYWAPGTSRWYDSEEKFVTYSQPLIDGDGQVYGVLGIELLDSDMMSMIPQSDMYVDQTGTYVMAKVHRKWTTLYMENVLVGGAYMNQNILTPNLPLTPIKGKKNCYRCEMGNKEYFVSAQDLSVYGENTPYARQEWMLLGFADEEELYQLSQRTRYMLGLTILAMLISGAVGSLLISRKLSGPIRRLADDVSRAKINKTGIPKLSETNITEIDHFAEAITALSKEVVHASTRFLRIIDMADGEIGGFEMRKGEAAVFLTDNFLSMLGIKVEEGFSPSEEQFKAIMTEMHETTPHTVHEDESCVYKIDEPGQQTHYVRVSVTKLDSTVTGIAEDVTPQTVEKKRIEHDRDYDLLTRQLNRRAFFREVGKIFKTDRQGSFGAVVMMDLDDLKKINDRFGHDWGDQYIQQAVRGFEAASPERSLMARLGGDEFVLFIYGYDSEEEIRDTVNTFAAKLQENSFATPEGGKRRVRASCGVSWYPQDSQKLPELMKYADFAMYQIKRSVKGSLGYFNMECYRQQTCFAIKRKELQEMLEKQLVQYHFQPIFNAKDGSVYAYEALMRVNMPTLQSPDAVVELARKENRLAEVERLTMLKASEYYNALLENQLVDERAYLFVNSIADQMIGEEDQKFLSEHFEDLVPRMVIEITESNDLNVETLEKKRRMTCFSGLFALDDYGNGYNGEKNLLALAPKYVKLDISIVSGIDKDYGKQHILSNLLSYAHQRDMLVVVEGLETLGEIQKCLELGADLLQGFALARPAAVPRAIERSAQNVIRYFWEKEGIKRDIP